MWVADMEKLLCLPTGDKFRFVRLRATLETLYSTGMRVSELLGLRLGQINLEDGSIRVLGKGDKERMVPTGLRAKEALLYYLDARARRFPGAGDVVFLTSKGVALTRTTFWWQLRSLARRVGITGRVFPHQIRHSCARRV